MFCPKCRDEFRSGFSRCARCNVDLVEQLPQEPAAARGVAAASSGPVRLVNYCGYLSLDEARAARDTLRQQRIRTEIAIREPPDLSWDGPVQEEYWLRIDVKYAREVAAALGDIPPVEEADPDEGSGFACGDCGQHVAADETFCPKCGARFDD